MITFDQARGIIDHQERPGWTGPGEFYVAPDGYEDDRGYLVDFGAREWLEGGDPQYMVLSGAVWFVDRRTGEVEVASATANFDRIDRMRPVVASV